VAHAHPRMAPTDPRSMLTLKCHCNNGIRCLDGVCDFRLVSYACQQDVMCVQETVPRGMYPACRYWSSVDFDKPLIDCWFDSRAFDRQVFVDDKTTHVICR
jgi:hypothetical protein